MIDYETFINIQKLKRQGFNKNRIAKFVKHDYKTIKKYWNMSPSSFKRRYKNLHCPGQKKTKTGKFDKDIKFFLDNYPYIEISKIYLFLKDKYKDEVKFTERALRYRIASMKCNMIENNYLQFN